MRKRPVKHYACPRCLKEGRNTPVLFDPDTDNMLCAPCREARHSEREAREKAGEARILWRRTFVRKLAGGGREEIAVEAIRDGPITASQSFLGTPDQGQMPITGRFWTLTRSWPKFEASLRAGGFSTAKPVARPANPKGFAH